jgi:hypothetical protein
MAWGKRHKVRLQPMLDSRPLIFRGEKMLRPYFSRFVRFYDMNCFLTGFEFSHSRFMGYYGCARSD